jgi:hypothetical protein
MSKRYPSGFISTFYDPLKNPDAPTIGTATAGDSTASVPFTAPADIGGSAITEYYARSTPEGVTASAASSPISVTGLTNGTAYTFAVWALNTYGPSPFSAASNSVSPLSPRALFYGGLTLGSIQQSTIDYVTIATLGNAANFGSLSIAVQNSGATGSSSRGLHGNYTNTIEYVTYSTTGNTTDFGDMTVARGGLNACNSATRSIFAGGGYADSNVIDFVTTASIGNATDFGDLTQRVSYGAGCSSPTRGVFAHGFANPGNDTNVISYITTATAGNSIDFGDLLNGDGAYYIGGCSSSTRGLFMGAQGSARGNVIQFITIATTGNGTDFGDCSFAGPGKTAASSQTRGLILGGNDGSGVPADARNIIEYVTIASTGNVTDFGDLTAVKLYGAASSGANGGLQ